MSVVGGPVTSSASEAPSDVMYASYDIRVLFVLSSMLTSVLALVFPPVLVFPLVVPFPRSTLFHDKLSEVPILYEFFNLVF